MNTTLQKMINSIYKPLAFTLFFASATLECGYNQADISEYNYFDNLAIEAQTDKSSNGHGYTKIYVDYFAHLRDKPIKFLEIGIDNGYSVKLWENYFVNAELHFMDITLERLKYSPKKSEFHLLDQANVSQLINFVNETGGQFDVIIDDGGHTMEQQINSFVTLFPTVKSGGLYIIEDLHTSYWKSYGGSGGEFTGTPKSNQNSTTEFLKKLVDDVNYTGAYSRSANYDKLTPAVKNKLTYYQKNILSLHFYGSVCVIIKR